MVLPDNNFKTWFGMWLVSGFVIEFFIKNKRFPTAFRISSVKVSGRTVSADLR